MDKQVGVDHHVQRGLERLDELVGQLADEAHGVAHVHGLSAGQLEAAGRGVQGGEEPVLHEDTGVGQPVQEG